jgi:hypothetical protein
MRRYNVFALALIVATTACMDESPADLDPQLSRAAATGPAGAALYEITVENLSTGQPFTPPVVAVHRQSIALFEMGEPASFEVQQIAENGNLDPMVMLAASSKQVADFGAAFGPAGPVLPGESASITLEGMTGAKYLSVVAMLICTNDGFTGTNSTRLPKEVGDVVTVDAVGYDAGTEMNTEDFTDLVPPCGPLTGFDPMGEGTGTSNPALAEDDVVRVHPGIQGIADLQVDPHGWTDPIATIRIERIG